MLVVVPKKARVCLGSPQQRSNSLYFDIPDMGKYGPNSKLVGLSS